MEMLAPCPDNIPQIIHQWDLQLPDGGGEVFQLVPREALWEETFKLLHDDHGHQGKERITVVLCSPWLLPLRQEYFWPGKNILKFRQ